MEEPLLPGKSPKWIPTVEPVVFLVSLATAIASITVQSFFIQRICEFNYANNRSNDLEIFCKNLTQHKEQEADVEAMAGTYASYRMVISSGPPLILALFWGQLNDRYGSKRLMFIPLSGYVLTNVIFYIMTHFPSSHPLWLLLALLPTGLTGGAISLTVCIFKLVVHKSKTEERTFRIGLAEGAMLIGGPLGLFLGAKIVDWGGFETVFLVSGILEIIAIIYAIFFIVDDGPQVSSNVDSQCWSLDRVRENLKVWGGPHKFLLLLLVIILSTRTFVMGGNTTIMYLSTRFRYGWDQLAYSTYFTFDGTLAAVGVLTVSTVALKMFHVSDALLGAICATSFAIGCTVWALAFQPWLMYLGSAIQLCEGISIIIVRSMISGIVATEDVGKALSLLAIPESLVPFLSTPLYNAIYIATLHSFVGTPFLLSAVLNLLVVIAFTYIHFAYPKIEAGTSSAPENLYTEERRTSSTQQR